MVIDTSPQRTLINVNVLNYVGEVLCPVDPGIFALSGLGTLREAVAEVAHHLDNRALRLGGLVLTRTQRDNITRDVEAQLRGTFGELVFRTTIPSTTKIGEAHARFLSVLDYAPRSSARRLTRPSFRRSSAMAKSSGLGNVPPGLLRPTTPATPETPAEALDDVPGPDEAEGQGRGEAPRTPRRTRRPGSAGARADAGRGRDEGPQAQPARRRP